MLTSLLLGAVMGMAPVANLQSVSGTVTYRERMALPPNAQLAVSLDRFGPDGQANVSELKLELNGRQVPIAFTLPYYLPGPAEGETFGVRAEIRVDGKRLFESESHAMVIANGQRRADITLVCVQELPGLGFVGVKWQLVQLDDQRITSERPPTLEFTAEGGEIRGFSGVNGFGGDYVFTAPQIQIDPGPMTLMAGSPEQMAVERRFLDVLVAVNRVEAFEGELTLYRGEKALARFRRSQ